MRLGHLIVQFVVFDDELVIALAYTGSHQSVLDDWRRVSCFRVKT